MSTTEPSKDRPANFRGTMLRMVGGMRTDRTRFIAILVFSVLNVGMMVAVPALLGRATDLVVDGMRADGVDFSAVGRVLAVASLLAVAAWATLVGTGRMIAIVVQRMAFRLRGQTDVKLARLPLRHFDSQSRGEVLSRATNDIDNLSQTVQQVFARVLTGLLMIVGSLVVMFWISPLLAAVVLVVLPVTIWVSAVIGTRAQPRFAAQWAATGKLNGHVEEMITGHELVTVFGRRAEAAQTFARHNAETYEASVKAQFLSGLIAPATMFLGYVTYVLVAVVGGLLVSSGSMSIGQIQAFIQYVMQVNNGVSGLAAMSAQIQSAVASAERVYDLLDADEQEPDPGIPQSPDRVTGRVVFSDVSFRYEPDEPLIDGLSLAVDPGQSVAIVGPTGAGKTTLVNLLMRFYEIDDGQITVDGVRTTDMSRDELRGRIGMVLQDTWLFGGTIADNIAYGRPDATREEVVAAARAVYADHLIRTLPDGYDTVVDEEGGGLSAGERQLITIARAFLIEPSILVLDEATSSVDTRTEMLVQQAMASLRHGRTSFVIAHRLSTIREADVILVMESGRIVEQGGHEALLAAGGAYARLYEAQFAQPVGAAS